MVLMMSVELVIQGDQQLVSSPEVLLILFDHCHPTGFVHHLLYDISVLAMEASMVDPDKLMLRRSR